MSHIIRRALVGLALSGAVAAGVAAVEVAPTVTTAVAPVAAVVTEAVLPSAPLAAASISGHNPYAMKFGWLDYRAVDKLCGWQGKRHWTITGARQDSAAHWAKYN